MSGDKALIRSLLKSGDLTKLFVVGLGWDRHGARLDVAAGGRDYALRAIAQKRGMVAYECAAGAAMPDYATRRLIERQVAKSVQEHLIVFTDAAVQVWQWVRREPGRPAACREHWYSLKQTGEALAQKLHAIAFSLEQEDGLDIGVVTRGARKGFDVERVTRAFYRDFDTHRKAFLKFIDGIGDAGDCEWYASVMLNRLMFVYFIQRKGFLDGDTNYLRQRLVRCRAERGKDKFYSFYRYFLLRLFHDGFGKRQRSAELKALLGNIPYLNGGLFDEHELEKPERYGRNIAIPDKAFERIFDYFDQYQWHLDERPLRADNEINPDVLGYIFEKYINQKQMGAYYTKEDITEYISKNTVLPFLFDAARNKCKVAFENAHGPTVWDLLRENPDRYIYPAVRHGMAKPLPAEIAKGLDTKKPNLIERRKPWNKAAPAEFALPTEIWREVVARRQRCEEVRRKLAAGEVREVNDFITLNLDLRQFAQDVVQNCEGPDLLTALWQAITTITVLDPTGGSGAFLFAALNILDPLYEACLSRMETFLAEWGEHGKKAHPNYHKTFTVVLARVADHPNRRYFVLKSIILNNLFAVDIMEEAVEICKLRLFLKLAAQVEPDNTQDNLGIEPLPDIDFNIRAGNSLVGYATAEEVRNRMTRSGAQSKFLGLQEDPQAFDRFNIRCAEVEQAFIKFRQLQTEGDGTVPPAHKLELQKRLKVLEDELNRHLAGEYSVKVSDKAACAQWLKSHQPFHWFIQFYGILNSGGFDVIIGNPPYVEYNAIKDSYTVSGYNTLECGNLYTLVLERSSALSHTRSSCGMIIPISLLCTNRMNTLRSHLSETNTRLWLANYDTIPCTLFSGIVQRNTILIAQRSIHRDNRLTYTTCLQKWYSDGRAALFAMVPFICLPNLSARALIPKISLNAEVSAIEKMRASASTVAACFAASGPVRFEYKRRWSYFLLFADRLERIRMPNGSEREQTDVKEVSLRQSRDKYAVLAVLSSGVFYFHYSVYSDYRHVNVSDFESFGFNYGALTEEQVRQLAMMGRNLMKNYKENLEWRSCNYKGSIGECLAPFYRQAPAKLIMDEIDTVLAGHYGFTAEELDFILNYDIKYRLGRGLKSTEE